MLFRRETLDGIADGSITLAFRRWARPAARSSGEQRTAIGVVRFGGVERIEVATISTGDAQAAGYPDRAALLAELAGRTGDLYRIELAGIGEDSRDALRELADVDPETLAWLRRTDWAHPILMVIDREPEVRAADLAQSLGVARDRFKARVRQLKDRGLTISLETGYRLSPRGAAALTQLSQSP